jgi:hypothetical protein
MTNRIAVLFAALVFAVAAPAFSQNTDPKASDLNGNGPPAWVMSKGQSDGAPSKEEQKKSAVERPLKGVVTDADGNPVAGAVVQLKNTRTLQVRSFITKDKGEYFFAGLSKDVDYEVKAQFSGKASTPRRLSTFDTKPEPVINLELK